mmetsp:Transcript_42455/g.128828  ORF Transcript_42455/g.128828 Transcript_42455/m.128828 type:complete len:204 (+) Transcript_42455:2243-2854(+)
MEQGFMSSRGIPLFVCKKYRKVVLIQHYNLPILPRCQAAGSLCWFLFCSCNRTTLLLITSRWNTLMLLSPHNLARPLCSCLLWGHLHIRIHDWLLRWHWRPRPDMGLPMHQLIVIMQLLEMTKSHLSISNGHCSRCVAACCSSWWWHLRCSRCFSTGRNTTRSRWLCVAITLPTSSRRDSRDDVNEEVVNLTFPHCCMDVLFL